MLSTAAINESTSHGRPHLKINRYSIGVIGRLSRGVTPVSNKFFARNKPIIRTETNKHPFAQSVLIIFFLNTSGFSGFFKSPPKNASGPQNQNVDFIDKR